MSVPRAQAGPDGTVRWAPLLEEATARLAAAGRESPAVDARRIVERAAGIEPAELASVLDRPVTTRQMVAFDRMLERRERGEPLQYVVGGWAFRTLDLFLDRRVLIPRPETEVVAGRALDEYDRAVAARGDRHGVVADLGTGSGAIALSIAVERPGATVFATERSPGAVEVARSNLAGLGRPARRVTIVEGSWFDPLPEALRGVLDVVVSNPPYVAAGDDLPAEVRDWEPNEALVPGPTGLEAYEAIVGEARGWLQPAGALVLEIGAAQGAAVRALAVASGFVDVVVAVDLAGRDRVVIARAG